MNSTQTGAHPAPNTLWLTDLTQPPAAPLLAVGGLLLVPTQESSPPVQHATLHGLSLADGSPCWQRSFEHALISGLASAHTLSPPHSHTPTLILVAITSTDLMRGEGALVALDAAGEERWRWAPGVQRVSAPVVRSDDFSRLATGATEVATTNLVCDLGDVACVTADARTLVVLDPATGEERGRVGLEASASLSAPAIVGGVAYVPCRGSHLLAVPLPPRHGGDKRGGWRFDAQAPEDAWLDKTPVVVGGRVFAVLSTGAVLALRTEDGCLAWRVDVGPAGKSLSPPATDGQRLFVGARDGLHALSLADGQEVWPFPTGRRIAAAPVLAGGVVYAACHDHHLYALDAATGQELWRHEVARRIEVPPVLATCGEPPAPCILVANRGGMLIAVACPLSAEALEAHARSLETTTCSAEERAAAWSAAAEAFEAEGETERAVACRQEVARCLRQPVITLDVKHEGLVLDGWSRLQFIVRNEGYGPARNLVIRASGDEFEGQVTATRQIATLRAGRGRTDWLDVRPREYGETVPLRVGVEYEDHVGEPRSCEHTIYIKVARTEATRREGERIGVFASARGAEEQRGRELASLRRQLEEACENLRLIEERKAQYVLEVDVPLQLIKEEGSLRERIAVLERRLDGLETARPPLPATTHVLSFDRLSPADFERLCLWLVEQEGYTRGEHLGLAGSEQGRDVVAYKPTPQGEELWYLQCKRYKSIRAKTLKDEVDKYLQLVEEKPHLRPAGVVFVVSCAVSAKVRENVGDYCEQHGLAHEFWALTELDMRVKRHPDLLREFFNLAP